MILSPTPVGKSFTIQKAWMNDDGSINVEGWISTNEEDLEKDVIEPEAFAGTTLSGYFERGAPISSEHNTRDMPVGYMLRSALVRDGQVFQMESNPRYPETDFKYFPETGTGWYGLGVIDEEIAARGISKGKISSFSWIGMPRAWTPKAGGGRHYTSPSSISPLLEATVTAYPINPNAVMRIAKAYGYSPSLRLTQQGVERVLLRK